MALRLRKFCVKGGFVYPLRFSQFRSLRVGSEVNSSTYTHYIFGCLLYLGFKGGPVGEMESSFTKGLFKNVLHPTERY